MHCITFGLGVMSFSNWILLSAVTVHLSSYTCYLLLYDCQQLIGKSPVPPKSLDLTEVPGCYQHGKLYIPIALYSTHVTLRFIFVTFGDWLLGPLGDVIYIFLRKECLLQHWRVEKWKRKIFAKFI